MHFLISVCLGLSLAAYRVYVAGSSVYHGHHGGSASAPPESFKDKCLKFNPHVPGSTFERVEYLAAGSKADLAYRDATCGGPGQSKPVTGEVCRIALYVPTSAESGIEFEAWLPELWSQRFLGTGNGGIAGCLDYASLAYGVNQGFATVASNNGHNGTSGLPFYHNDEVLHDFADRALHTSVEVGKDVVKQFYHKKHKRSYYLGCSQGGRQGVASAQKYPSDFDGIVPGSPALDFNSLVSYRASFYPITGPSDSPDFIKPDIWSNLIHNEVLKQCDHIDGVLDGIIEYPDLCHFDPGLLLCAAGQTAGTSCLSQKQVDVVRRVFQPFTYPDGTLIYPGMQTGSEQYATERLYAGKPFSDSQDWFRYVVNLDPKWDPLTFTTEDARKAQALNPFDIRTFPSVGDLAPFKSRGGKLLTYHGMQDQQITGHDTGRWLDYLLLQSSSADLDEWLRYFRVSGLLHCFGGPGACAIGNAEDGAQFEPGKNVLAAIVEWVENGVAPETLEGTKFATGSTTAVQFTRKHCRYPKRNLYIGQKAAGGGLPTASTADEWVCQ